jgi:hypothetical protein
MMASSTPPEPQPREGIQPPSNPSAASQGPADEDQGLRRSANQNMGGNQDGADSLQTGQTDNAISADQGIENEYLWRNIEEYIESHRRDEGPRSDPTCCICWHPLFVKGWSPESGWPASEPPVILDCGHVVGSTCFSHLAVGFQSSDGHIACPLAPFCQAVHFFPMIRINWL